MNVTRGIKVLRLRKLTVDSRRWELGNTNPVRRGKLNEQCVLRQSCDESKLFPSLESTFVECSLFHTLGSSSQNSTTTADSATSAPRECVNDTNRGATEARGCRQRQATSNFLTSANCQLSTANSRRLIKNDPSTNTSISVRKKQLIASVGVRTIGSFSLSEVFKMIGTPVFS